MTPRHVIAPSLSVLLAFVAIQGCSSSSGKGSGGAPPGIYCSASLAGTKVCYGYSNLTPDEQSAVSSACTQSLQGTITGTCPSGQLGCCSTTAGYTTTECYYAGTASTLQQACKTSGGTWSADGGGGSSSGGSSSGASSSGAGSSSGSGTSSSGGSGSGSSGGTSSSGSGSCPGSEVVCPKGCADLETDVNNCGSCGYRCPTGASGTKASCVAGACKYACTTSGDTLCDAGSSSGYCANLHSDPVNCGSCGNDCNYSAPFGAVAGCSNGTCTYGCGSGQALCGGQCIDVTSDDSNCGNCNVVCPANTVCKSGGCVPGCVSGETLCSSGCTSTQSDSNNCGTCGNVCPYTANSCVGGNCTCEVYCVDQVGDPYCCKGGQSCYQNGCL